MRKEIEFNDGAAVFTWTGVLYYYRSTRFSQSIILCKTGIKRFFDIPKPEPTKITLVFTDYPLVNSYRMGEHQSVGLIRLDTFGVWVGDFERRKFESLMSDGYKYVRCEYDEGS